MRLLITGADQVLGQYMTDVLRADHTVVPLTRSQCDHRNPENIAPHCDHIDAIVHCDVFDPPAQDDRDCLDWASRGTYVLMEAGRTAGVERVVLASRIDLFASYPDHFVVDETWRPKPLDNAVSLAPYMAELTCREFAREGGLCVVCLRLDALETDLPKDVSQAFLGALAVPFEPLGYRWQLYHVSANERFPMRSGRKALGLV